MPTSISRTEFLKSEKGSELRDALNAMVKSPLYNTGYAYYRLDTDGSQFVEKHMNYMSSYPNMDHWQYVANLKLMTKIGKR